jgi:hypothetical protein
MEFKNMTDVRLDEGSDGSFIVLEGRVVKAAGSDFMLDSSERRIGKKPFRRALVHDQNDGLTVNFNGDYPGGVTLVDVKTLEVRGDITFGMPGIRATGPGIVMIPTSLTKQISDLQSQINQLTAKVEALEAKQ